MQASRGAAATCGLLPAQQKKTGRPPGAPFRSGRWGAAARTDAQPPPLRRTARAAGALAAALLLLYFDLVESVTPYRRRIAAEVAPGPCAVRYRGLPAERVAPLAGAANSAAADAAAAPRA